MKARGLRISYWDVCNFQGNGVCFVIVFGVFHIRIFAIFIKKRYWLIEMRCREVILRGAAKQEWKGIEAAVPSAPSLPIGFTKQNLWCIGRIANSIPNGFFGMATRKLCCMGNVVPFAPLLPIGFAKQNLRGIGRMANATLNGFFGMATRKLCCMINVVPSAPSLSISFAKQNLWCIGRIANSIPNGFFGMATRKLCCMGNVVSLAPLLAIGFAKQNLWCIGRMVNATPNGFASVVKQYLRLVKTQHSQSPCAQKTVSVSQLSLHNCPFIFLLLALCASLFPFHSPLFTFLPLGVALYFFTFRRSPLLFYLFTFLLFNSPSF